MTRQPQNTVKWIGEIARTGALVLFASVPPCASFAVMTALSHFWKTFRDALPGRETWRPLAVYGALIALGGAGLGWLQMQRLARSLPGEVHIGIVAVAFLTLGLWAGARLFGASPAPPAGNPEAADTLGLTAREQEILSLLSAGLTNKEIAQRLSVSPNTIKTHLAHLFEKLGAKRRTEAVARARELNLLP
jgi:DNA-binding CsgD family transcriptional regulator